VAERLARLRRANRDRDTAAAAQPAPAEDTQAAQGNDTIVETGETTDDPRDTIAPDSDLGDTLRTAISASLSPAPSDGDGDATLPPEDEAALQAELAAIAAENGPSPAIETAVATTSGAATASAAAASTSPAALATQDSVRLFDTTDSRMADDETVRRRANIEHLKAAVAARTAEAQLGTGAMTGTGDATAAYREDLAQVMRPRRVRVDTGRRLAFSREAPLVLVSEQRVDAVQTAAQTAPAPRPTITGAATARGLPPLTLDAAHRVDAATPQAQPDTPAPADTEAAREHAMSASLARLAERTGMIMRDANAAAQAAAAQRATDAPGEDTAEAEADSDAEADAAAATVETAQANAAAEPQQAASPAGGDADQNADTDQAQTESETEAEPLDRANDPDVFAAELENSDAVEVEDVVLLATAHFQRERPSGGFKRPELVRLISGATDDSIQRDEILEAFGKLVSEGVVARGDGEYFLIDVSENSDAT